MRLLYELVAQVLRCGSTKWKVTGSIPNDEIKLELSGTGVPGFTSTVLPDSDVPHFCQLKSCVEELCGHIRETVVWERNMGKDLLD